MPPRTRDIYMKLDAYEQTSAGAGARENLYEGTGRKSRRRRVVINTRESPIGRDAPVVFCCFFELGKSCIAGESVRDSERERRRRDATSRSRCISMCLNDV